MLVVKGDEKKTFVREAVYTGKGYWRGFGDAPVLAWRPLPHTPITLALKTVLDERDVILDTLERKRTAQQNKRLLEIDREIEMAQQARDTKHERFLRECLEALSAPFPPTKEAAQAVANELTPYFTNNCNAAETAGIEPATVSIIAGAVESIISRYFRPDKTEKIDAALAAVISFAEQDMEAIAKEAGSKPPGVQYPGERYTVIVRRTKGHRKSNH